MQERLPIRTTLAIASSAPIGVISVVMKKGLSRIFLWDIGTDKITPGQFLKGDALVQDITSDGKYFSYTAYNYYRPNYFSDGTSHQRPQRYTCVARPPYFTALAFFPTDEYSVSGINFLNDETMIVQAHNASGIDDRICPDCPLSIDRNTGLIRLVGHVAYDFINDRHLIGVDNKIVLRHEDVDEIVREFSFENFEAIEPPDWAKVW